MVQIAIRLSEQEKRRLRNEPPSTTLPFRKSCAASSVNILEVWTMDEELEF